MSTVRFFAATYSRLGFRRLRRALALGRLAAEEAAYVARHRQVVTLLNLVKTARKVDVDRLQQEVMVWCCGTMTTWDRELHSHEAGAKGHARWRDPRPDRSRRARFSESTSMLHQLLQKGDHGDKKTFDIKLQCWSYDLTVPTASCMITHGYHHYWLDSIGSAALNPVVSGLEGRRVQYPSQTASSVAGLFAASIKARILSTFCAPWNSTPLLTSTPTTCPL